jgi:hypothetical protein
MSENLLIFITEKKHGNNDGQYIHQWKEKFEEKKSCRLRRKVIGNLKSDWDEEHQNKCNS